MGHVAFTTGLGAALDLIGNSLHVIVATCIALVFGAQTCTVDGACGY